MKLVTSLNGLASRSWMVITPQLMGRSVRERDRLRQFLITEFVRVLSMHNATLKTSIVFLAMGCLVSLWPGGRLSAQHGPVARRAHTTAYHAGLELVVVFGGQGAGGEVLADLWGWDGERWRPLDQGEPGPPPRSRHAMAYDPMNDRLVIHGGGTVERDFGDTWTWTAQGWKRLEAEGPGPRSHHHMAYDPGSGGLVLYGGGRSDEGFGHDTWTLRGGAWRRSDAILRPGRVLAGMASSRRGILLFGGLVRQAPRSAALWRWHGGRWTLVREGGPPGLIYPGVVWNRATNRLLLFGGEADAGLTDEMWTWDGSNWARPEGTRRPPPRTEHRLAYDRRRRVVVLFGGRTAGGPANDVWEWDGDRWTRVW